MADLGITALKAEVNENITTNGEQQITGAILNDALIDTIDTLQKAATVHDGLYWNGQAGDVVAKTISANDFILTPGGSIKVRFENANTAASATLNVNGTGAHSIVFNGGLTTETNTWGANEIIEFTYNNYNAGTWEARVWRLEKVSVSQNTETGKTQLEIGGIPELTVDKIPESYSPNLIESGGVYTEFSKDIIGTAYDGFTPTQIYTQITARCEKVVFKVVLSQNVDAVCIDIATSSSASAITKSLVTNKNLVAGIYYFMVELEGEQYVRCMSDNAATNKVHIDICEIIQKEVKELANQSLITQKSKPLTVKTVSTAYTEITKNTGPIIVEVTFSTSGVKNLELATSNSESAITTKILDRIYKEAGIYLFLVNQNNEGYLRDLHDGVAPSNDTIKIYRVLNEDFNKFKENALNELCGDSIDEITITASSQYYSNITQRAGNIIVKVVITSDLSNFHLSLNTSGSASGDTHIIYGDAPIAEGTYYFYVPQNNESKLRCYSTNTITSPIGVIITTYETLKHKQVELPTPEQIGAVNSYQGSNNQNKVLIIGADGIVVPGYVTPQGTIEIEGLALEGSKTLYLGDNLIADSSFTLVGFTGNMSDGFTVPASTTGSIEFNFDTVAGKKYVILLTSATETNNLYVTIGDEPKVDTYRTVGELNVGFISQGGKLKFERPTYYNAPALTITNIQLREIVPMEDAVVTKVVSTNNVKFIEGVFGDFWNIAVGPIDTMAAMQNGSRNIAIGKSSMQGFKSGTRNISIGTFSHCNLEYGDYNIAIGSDCNWQTKRAVSTIAIGMGAIGAMKLINGVPAMGETLRCIAIGHDAMGGSGIDAQRTQLLTPTDCVAIGHNAGKVQHDRCVAIGSDAGLASYGHSNTYIGFHTSNSGNGNENVAIGAYAQSNGHNNTVAIGVGANAEKDNQAVLGRSSITETKLFGNIVIRDNGGVLHKLKFNDDNSVTWESVS